ncbi:MAG: DinB family protein [candidate division WOR-3 bacterium]|nr:MAG: DinB family protein [candidate division WOR-3 bacterium]
MEDPKGLMRVVKFMYGDVASPEGFWYSHQVKDVRGLSEEKLYWVPDPKSLCMLWHVGHIAHRERTHIGQFLQGLDPPLVPPEFEVFGPDWHPVEEVRNAVKSVTDVFDWAAQVRRQSQEYLAPLEPGDLFRELEFPEKGLTVAHWLFITAAHTALHVGKIQLLRALAQGEPDRAC